jgi:hypothetical protein
MREENKLIAEFMGYKTYEHTNSIAIRLLEENEFNSIDIGHIHTKFHTSWDWLMPVVEKIESLNFSIEMNKQEEGDYQCLIIKKDILVQTFSNNKIEAVYNAVIKFIKNK